MDISQITDQLYIAAHPQAEDAERVKELNVRLILNMIFIPPAEVYGQPPFRMVTLRSFDSIFLPIPMYKLVKGVEASIPVIAAGESVLVYCREGRHRSVAMAAAVLIGQGYNAFDAMQLIKTRRAKADPYAWHIKRRIIKFAEIWQKKRADFD